MKNLLLLVFIGLSFSITAQTVVKERVSELMDELYSIDGEAFLEELDNGDLQLRLSSDFSTPFGPDVRIFLNNSIGTSGAVEVVDLSAIGHFSGAATFPVPAGVDIEDFDFIVFFCFAFNQLWASGEFGDVNSSGPTCSTSSVLNPTGPNVVDICPSDNNPDVVEFSNTLGIPAGTEYVYLITDNNQNLEEVVMADEYDFEGSSSNTQRVYGMHYSGTLNTFIGNNRIFTTASGCFEHSSGSTFIRINKDACATCDTSNVTIAGGATSIDICPTDNNNDVIEFENSLELDAGDEYVYLITDEDEILEEVVEADEYDFEGSTSSTQRVYGLNYDGDLDVSIGSIRTATTASGCFEHSDSDDFITITKDACFECETSTVTDTTGSSVVDICPSDSNDDIIEFENSLDISAGSNFVYLLTDANEILEEVIMADNYNFEGTSSDEQRIYGLHYDGVLSVAIGSDRTLTTADGCFEHTTGNNFLSISKNGCFVCESSTVSDINGANSIDICPSDSDDDIIELENSLGISATGNNYVYLLTDENQTLQEVIMADSYNFEGTSSDEQRIYGMHYDGTLMTAVGFNRTLTTASGCSEQSDADDFVTITKNACFLCESSTVSNASGANAIDICPSDSNDDIIQLENSLGLSAGSNYVYLLTDANEVLEEVIMADSYNFEGSGNNEQRVYGMHYDGVLNAVVGSDRTLTTADGCFEHSNGNDFITVTKNDCFVCQPNTLFNANGTNAIDICPSDSNDDIVQFENSLGLNAGSNYVYLLTDANELLQEVIMTDSYNFEGTNSDEQRVYGMHYDGVLNPVIGSDRTLTTASGCFEQTIGSNFISITKNDCFVCEVNSVANANGMNAIDICPSDSNDDIIQLENSLGLSAGSNYVYLLTDANEILQQVIMGDNFNFEGTSANEQRVYGMHFDGTLNIQVGFIRSATSATGCFEHSSATDFITVTKNACFVCEPSDVTNVSGANAIDICPSDANNDIVQLQNSLGLSAGSNYVYLLTDANEILQEVIMADSYNFEGTDNDEQRIYGMHYDGALNPAIGLNRSFSMASGCFEHSSATDFISITKNACFVCEISTVSNANGSNSLNICPTDSNSDIISLSNSLGLNAGANYVYLLTDASEILQEVITADQYNFEGSTTSEQRVYGLHFDGTLIPAIGSVRTSTTASGCFEHSANTQFIAVNKNACFDCNLSTVSNANGSNAIDICPADSDDDIVLFENSLGLAAGTEYVYLITDDNQVLQEVVMVDSYDFEGSGPASQRVYGLHFDGTLDIQLGLDRTMTTASGCFEHSDNNTFISITKDACVTCEVSTLTSNGQNSFDVCPADNASDLITLQNSLGLSAGTNYVYLLTDENEILEEVIQADQYDFEGTALTTQRIYGLHFDGTLNAAIGQVRMATTASRCFEHSSANDFISVTKNACFDCNMSTVSNVNGNNSIDICPNDLSDDVIFFENSLGLEAGLNYAYLITDENEILQEVVTGDSYDFEGSSLGGQRVYGMHFDGTLNVAIGFNRLATSADGCFEHSSANDFISVTKNACFSCSISTVSNSGGNNILNICPTDGNDDIVNLENSLGVLAGANYVYLLTDANEILQEVIAADLYNFEGSTIDEQRIYGLHFDGTLNPVIGAARTATTASGCFEHSNAIDFVTVNKNACFDCNANSVSNSNGGNTIDICPNDNAADIVSLQNSLSLSAGANYVYLLTDANEILLEVIATDSYNFEGTGLAEQRIYGLHFEGTLNPVIGADRMATMASSCFEHSSANDFISVSKNACFECNTSTVNNANGSSEIDLCPTDNSDDVIGLQNSLGLSAGANYVYLLTDANEILQEVISADTYNFEGTTLDDQRIYGLHFDGDLSAAIGSNRMSTTASGCFEHSNPSDFVSITKNACFECSPNTVSNANGSNSINICTSDNETDLVNLENSLGLAPGANYLYLLTDANEIVQDVIITESFDFEGTGSDEQRIYGFHFDGTLDLAIGENRFQTTASGCFEHSSSDDFITIRKDACFECNTSEVNNANGSNNIDICPNDNIDDLIVFENSLGLAAGSNYAYLLTDENEILLEVINSDQYNFETSSLEEQRVYGVHFDGDLMPQIGQNRAMTTASGCFEHSNATVFISVTKNACVSDFECLTSLTATTDWVSMVDICPSDGVADWIELRNTLFIPADGHYAYLITDQNDVLQTVVMDTIYNFEGTTLDEQRVYGIHFDGNLIPAIGEDRLNTSASGCFEHSGGNIFLTITKNACVSDFECLTSLTATTDWVAMVDICPDDGEDDWIELRNTLFVPADGHYAYLITDVNETLLEVVTDTVYNFEGSGPQAQRVYGIHFDGNLMPQIGENRLMTTASGCFEHSGGNIFLTITKGACETDFVCVESLVATHAWVTDVDVCANDGEDDWVFIQNNILTPPGSNYAFLLTDEFEVLQEVIIDTTYNFENTGLEEQRVYGISYSGTLEAKIGEDRRNTTASNCYVHSGDDFFITINKTGACNSTSTQDLDLQNSINVYPNPSSGLINIDYSRSELEFTNVSLYDIRGRKIRDINNEKNLEIQSPGIYLLKFSNAQLLITKKIIIQ